MNTDGIEYVDSDGNLVKVLAYGGIAAGISLISFLGGLITGKGAATNENSRKLYKIAMGRKIDEVFTKKEQEKYEEQERKELERAINNNRAKKSKAAEAGNN